MPDLRKTWSALARDGFQRLYKAGPPSLKRAGNRFFLVLALPGDSGGLSIGISVSRKIARRAVKRNRIRRMIFESVRQMAPHIRPEFAVAILARPGAADLKKQQDAAGPLRELFTRAGLLEKP